MTDQTQPPLPPKKTRGYVRRGAAYAEIPRSPKAKPAVESKAESIPESPTSPQSKTQAKTEPESSSTEESKAPAKNSEIFLALQGGGAKGIVHVGGLTAINEMDIGIKAVAGTSAGAIVAALIAAGYTGKELFDVDNGRHLFADFPADSKVKKPTDLFTRRGWWALKSIRETLSFAKKVSVGRHWLLAIELLFLLALIVVGFFKVDQSFPQVFPWLCGMTTLIIAGFVYKLATGITTVKKVRDFIDKAIIAKMNHRSVDASNITFEELANDQEHPIPLKIVATNSSSECLELFCLERTPNVAIADAVAASICLPVIFTPFKFSFKRKGSKKLFKGKFLDGGLVSNLPAWPFDEERELYPHVPTVALNIASPVVESDKHWLFSVANTVVNGTSEVHTRAAGRMSKIALSTKLELLEFDADLERFSEEVLRARLQVRNQLDRDLRDVPMILNKTAKHIRSRVLEVFMMGNGVWHNGLALSSRGIRVAIGVQRAGFANSISVVATSGYRPVDRPTSVTRPLKADGAGEAWLTQRVKHFETIHSGDDVTKLRSKGIWEKTQWAFHIPLTPDGRIDFRNYVPCVITIDSDISVDYRLPDAKLHFMDFARCVTAIVNSYNENEQDRIGIAQFLQGRTACL